jgi:hypothetical protein
MEAGCGYPCIVKSNLLYKYPMATLSNFDQICLRGWATLQAQKALKR